MHRLAFYPLAEICQRYLDDLVALAELTPAALPTAAVLMTARARRQPLPVAGRVSAGGGCRIYATADGYAALNLARGDDWTLLPALFAVDGLVGSHEALAEHFAGTRESEIVARGRLLGLAIAGLSETAPGPALHTTTTAAAAHQPRPRPRVIDLSALWAGPLAGQLLARAGCAVTRIESLSRADPLRKSDPQLFAQLADGKATAVLDLSSEAGRAALVDHIAAADIVIEAARPRALQQLGIDADRLVAGRTGLTWITITGHGIAGEAGNWIGFGDDAAVAGGLSREAWALTGIPAFVGDAIADPIAGMLAAHTALAAHHSGQAARIVISMSGAVHAGIAAAKAGDVDQWHADLAYMIAHAGKPYAAYLDSLALAREPVC